MRSNSKSRIALVVLALGSLLTPRASAADAYYMMLFTYEGRPNLPRLAHTFATFVKVPDDRGDADASRSESHTISWLPATLNVIVLRPRAEPGRNLDLATTLQLGTSQGAVISAWGPYRIKKELYDRARAQIGRLNRGAIAYKAMDGGLRPEIATNCFHAISDIVDGPLLNTGTTFGEPATEMVRDHFSRWIIQPDTTYRWLLGPSGSTNTRSNFDRDRERGGQRAMGSQNQMLRYEYSAASLSTVFSAPRRLLGVE